MVCIDKLKLRHAVLHVGVGRRFGRKALCLNCYLHTSDFIWLNIGLINRY